MNACNIKGSDFDQKELSEIRDAAASHSLVVLIRRAEQAEQARREGLPPGVSYSSGMESPYY